MDIIKNEGIKMSNFLYKLFILFFVVLMTLIMTLIMIPITFAIIIIEWMCGLFVSSDDDK